MWLLLSILSAFWFKAEIASFAIRINRQIYQEVTSIHRLDLTEKQFIANSSLKPQQTRWANLFFLLFPLIMYCSENPTIGVIFILLCFLSLLDICYYLTDTRYIGLIFLLVLWEGLNNFHNETLLFTYLFCLFITLFSSLIFKKETFGSGDMLLLLALSPLFDVEKMLLLILIACLLGIFYYFAYWWIKKQNLEKLAFIPFISLAVGIVNCGLKI